MTDLPLIGQRVRDCLTNEVGEFRGLTEGGNLSFRFGDGRRFYVKSALARIGACWFLNANIAGESKPAEPKKKRGRKPGTTGGLAAAAKELGIDADILRQRCVACGSTLEEYLRSEAEESEAA